MGLGEAGARRGISAMGIALSDLALGGSPAVESDRAGFERSARCSRCSARADHGLRGRAAASRRRDAAQRAGVGFSSKLLTSQNTAGAGVSAGKVLANSFATSLHVPPCPQSTVYATVGPPL